MFVFNTLVIFLMAVLLIMAIKNYITYINHKVIMDAIYNYYIDCLAKERHNYRDDVAYVDMEPYDKTLFRLYDWGYTRILPKEKYEIIKPYIEENKK